MKICVYEGGVRLTTVSGWAEYDSNGKLLSACEIGRLGNFPDHIEVKVSMNGEITHFFNSQNLSDKG